MEIIIQSRELFTGVHKRDTRVTPMKSILLHNNLIGHALAHPRSVHPAVLHRAGVPRIPRLPPLARRRVRRWDTLCEVQGDDEALPDRGAEVLLVRRMRLPRPPHGRDHLPRLPHLPHYVALRHLPDEPHPHRTQRQAGRAGNRSHLQDGVADVQPDPRLAQREGRRDGVAVRGASERDGGGRRDVRGREATLQGAEPAIAPVRL